MTLDVQHSMNEYWTARAAAYDDHQLRPERREVDHAAWSTIYRQVLGEAPRRVLDVGTGSGYVAHLLADLGHDVVGIDLAEGMIERAREHADLRQNAPEFLIGDAVAPPFPAGSFEVLVNRYVMWTLREPKDALAHWKTLLRPGGTLAVVDTMHFPEGLQVGASPEFAAAYTDEVGAALPLAETRTIDPLVDMIAAAGFTDVRAEPLHSIHALDTELGVAPNHEVRLQYLVTATRP